MTKKQQLDIEVCKYFIHPAMRNIPITKEDEKKYLEWSEKGWHKDYLKTSYFNDGFNVLVSGRRWKDIHLEMWREGMNELTCFKEELLEGTPEAVRKMIIAEL